MVRRVVLLRWRSVRAATSGSRPRAGPPTPPAHVLRRVSSSLRSCGPRLVRAAGRFAPRGRPAARWGCASRQKTPFAPLTRGGGWCVLRVRRFASAPAHCAAARLPAAAGRSRRKAPLASPGPKCGPGAGRKTSPRPHPPIKQATTLGRAKAKAHRPRYARRSITYDDCATSESAEAPNDRTGRQHHQRQRRCREPTHQHRRDRCHAQSR